MPNADLIDLVERTLADLVDGFAPAREHRWVAVSRPHVVGRVGGVELLVEVKTVASPVVDDVLARLALGVLQARRDVVGSASPMVAVVVPSLGKKVETAASRFMAEHALEVGWALVDHLGNARVVVPSLRLDLEKRCARVATANPNRASVRLFSDLNRWLLKVLLLADAPDELWQGPRRPVLSASDLSQAAGVSPEMVRRFLNAFEEQDFLRRSPNGLRLVRRSALLELWRANEALDVRAGVAVQRMLRGSGAWQGLVATPGFADAVVVAGFEACRLLGILHAATPALPEVHAVLPISTIVNRFGLEECLPAEAELVLLPPRHPASVLRGRLRREGLWVADPLQAGLDVLRHPARGHEQSEYVLKEVLGLEGDEP
jgi:hypothetical protein